MHIPKEILELKRQDEKVQQVFYLEDIQAFHPYRVQTDQLRSMAPGGNKAPLALLVPPRLASPEGSHWGVLPGSASPRKPGGACQGSALQKKE